MGREALREQIDDILRELLREPGILAATVAQAGEDALDGELATVGTPRRAPLGAGAELVVRVSNQDPALLAAIERAARELRAAVRLAGDGELPTVHPAVGGQARRSRVAMLARINRFLEAFTTALGASATTVVWRGDLLAQAGALDEARRERLSFVCKQVDLAAKKNAGKSSHAELAREELWACSFYFDAHFVAFFDRPYAPDFVRHRARAVLREIAEILPHLDEGPTTPVQTKPV